MFVEVFVAQREFPRRGQRKKVKSEAQATALGGGGRGRTPDPLFPTPTLGPPPHAGGSPSSEG